MPRYNPKQLQKNWSAKWLKDKIYEPDFSVRRAPFQGLRARQGLERQDKKRGKKPFYNLMMFPYPSAEGLHVGNMYAFVGADIYGRKKRMEGFDVFEPIGLDGFGIHSENYAIKIGAHPMKLAQKTQKNFYNQLQMIGNGFAWKEKLETYDSAYYKWTQWIFVQIFKKGLAYRKKAPVNWCPSCKTVLSDEQVISGQCERCGSKVIKKDLTQWFFKITDYAERLLNDIEKIDWSEKIKIAQKNWIGKSEGALIKFQITKSKLQINSKSQISNEESIEVFTTRPDTLFGVTYMVVSPEHEIILNLKSKILNLKEVEEYIQKAKNTSEEDRIIENKEKTGIELKGIKAINPANGDEISIWVADYVLGNVGTGAIMAVPAHDQRDFKFARKYKLSIKPVIKPYQASYLIIEKSLSNIKEVDLKNFGDVVVEKEDQNWGKFYRVKVSLKNEEKLIKYLESNLLETSEDGGAWYADSMGTTNTVVFPGKTFHVFDDKSFKEYENYGLNVGIPKNQLDIKLNAYAGGGILFGSGQFSGMDSSQAKWGITKFVGGKKETHFRLRDWLISRQRYWGPPIPMIFCDACAKKGKGEQKEMPGWYAVPEKDLPVKLPFVKEFRPTGKDESPLASVSSFYKVKCPSCKSVARRETDVSDTFLDSVWYYLRYPSVTEKKNSWNKDITKKWLPVHMYIGGAEHAVLHLLYTRFLAKVFYDWKLTHFREPFSRFRAHGLLIKDGAKMSKSKGNVVNPDEYIKVYGADALRMYLMFLGPFEQGGDFRDDGIRGITRFLERVWKFVGGKKEFAKPEIMDKDNRHSFEHALHHAMRKVTEDIDMLGYNTAISQLMILLHEFEEKEEVLRKEDIKIFLRLLAPFAPFITEELWSVLGEKKSIHISEWPSFDAKKAEYGAFEMVIQINGKVRDTVLVLVSLSEKEMEKEALGRERIKEILGTQKPKKIIVVPKRLVNIVV